MAAPEGNQNAAKGRRWRDAIEEALNRRGRGDGQEALVQIAGALLTRAEVGDIAAIKELGDRFDGKASQAVTVLGDASQPLLQHITVELVRASTDSTDPGST